MADTSPANSEIIAFLRRLAALMEFAGTKPFGVRAFDNAARMLEELEVDIAELSAAGTLTDLEGVGKGVAGAVAEFIEGPVTSQVTASALQLHPDAIVILDEGAASKLKHADYYKWVYAQKPSAMELLHG